MSMRTLFAIGWWGTVPLPSQVPLVRLPTERWTRAFEPRRGGSVALLGGEALTRLAAEAVRRRLHPPYSLAIAVPESRFFGPVSAWEALEGCELAAPGRLEAALARAMETPVRVHLPARAWLPKAGSASPEMLRLADLLARASVARVEEWRRVSGLGAHRLNAVCKRETGMVASQVARAYRRAYRDGETDPAVTRRHLALSLGYSDPRSLRRAF